MQSICEFFGVEEHEIMLPHVDFEEIVRLKRDTSSRSFAYTPYLENLARRSRDDLSEYDGFYFEYSYTMTYPGLILRALMRMKTENGVSSYQRVENLARIGQPGRRIRGRYRGMAFYLNDRIFQVDFDAMTGDEISQTILYPNFLNRHERLPGLKLGVSTTSVREPLCARVLHVSLGENINVREALGKCGVFDPDSAEIDPSIRKMIENKIEDGAYHFNVVTRI